MSTNEVMNEAMRDFQKNSGVIDWDKVKTFEDFLLIHRSITYETRIHREHPAFHQLKRFLKSESDAQS